jgi:hypothetical protein
MLRTTQVTFLPSLVTIDLVVSGKDIKIFKNRQRWMSDDGNSLYEP